MSPELPAHAELARAAVCDGLPAAPCLTSAGLKSLRGRLAARLVPIAAMLGPGVEVVVDRYCLGASACPASALRDPFEWSAAFAARSLGLRALRQMLGASHPGPLCAVEEAIDEAICEGASVGKWLCNQDGPSRGSTVVAAASWASRAWVAVPWSRLGTTNLSERAIWARPLGVRGAIVLKARCDAAIRPAGRRPGEVVLLSLDAGGAAGRLDLLGFTLFRGFVPLRVVEVQASSGSVSSADVSAEMLEEATDAVVEAVGALAAGMGGGGTPEVPGDQCPSCARLARCCSGSAWLRGRERRVGGIPVAWA